MIPILSIVVPIYNIEAFLEKCVNSILNSTFSDFELILVDDGSTDSCGKMCDKYAELDERVKVIHKKNGGLVSARKAGVAIASGKYVTFVDGDDYIDELLFEKAVASMIEHDSDMLNYGFTRCDSIGRPIRHSRNELADGKYVVSDYMNYYSEQSEQLKFYHAAWNKMYKNHFLKEAMKKVDDTVTKGEDLCLTLSFLGMVHDFYNDNSIVGYNYVDRSSSMTHVYDKLNVQHTGNCIKNILKLSDDDKGWNTILYNEAFNLVMSDCIGCTFEYYGKSRPLSIVRYFRRLANDGLVSSLFKNGVSGGYFKNNRRTFADYMVQKSYVRALIFRLKKKV